MVVGARKLGQKSISPVALATALMLCWTGLRCNGDPDDDAWRWSNGGRNNRAPVVQEVGEYALFEGQSIDVTVSAYDPDQDSLTFGVTNLPENATIDEVSGVFSWTPLPGASHQSPFWLDFTVSDDTFVVHSRGIFVVSTPPVSITSVSPYRITRDGGAILSIVGAGFEEPMTVTIGGVPVESSTLLNVNSLEVIAPAMPENFGPQALVVRITDERFATRQNAVFVYSDSFTFDRAMLTAPLSSQMAQWAAGDVDGDERDEVIVGHSTGLDVIDFENWDATLSTISSLVPQQIVIADFDGDRIEEVAVLDDNGVVHVLEAASPFASMVLTNEGIVATAIGAYDLEPDGDFEVTVVDDNGQYWVYASLGESGFTEPFNSTGLFIPERIEMVDVAGSRTPDMLLHLESGFSVSIGIITGVFGAPSFDTADVGFTRPQAEWDDDGQQWVITTLGDGTVGVFEHRSDNDWRLERERQFETISGEYFLVDLLEGGHLEGIAMPEEGFGFRVDSFANDTLIKSTWAMAGPVQGTPLLADIDGDTSDELVLRRQAADEMIIFARGNEWTGIDVPIGLPGESETGIVVRDFTRTGFPDIVFVGSSLDGFPVHLLFRGEGRPDYDVAIRALPSIPDAELVVFSDVTRDGNIDIVSYETSGDIVCQRALSPLTYAPPIAFSPAHSGAVIDMMDVMVGAFFNLVVLFDDGTVWVLEADSLCQWTQSEEIPVVSSQLVVADLDRNTWPELAVISTDGDVVIYQDDELGGFFEFARIPTLGHSINHFVTADVTGDGVVDLVVAANDGVFVIEGPLDDLSESLVEQQIDSGPATEVAAGDLNGDGLEEIVALGGGNAPRIFILGPGSLVQMDFPDWHADGQNPWLVDIERDFDLDLVTFQPGFGAVIWTNRVSD